MMRLNIVTSGMYTTSHIRQQNMSTMRSCDIADLSGPAIKIVVKLSEIFLKYRVTMETCGNGQEIR